MSKELEALENIKLGLKGHCKNSCYQDYCLKKEELKEQLLKYDTYFSIIEIALKDYERRLKLAKEYEDVNNVAKRLKALEIIKEKKVNVGYLLQMIDLFGVEKALENYNQSCFGIVKPLTQKEYELLVEVLL